ncbi:mitochondrial thiamine pyrophosphate transporter [Gaertneriomyces sp. JEL0708]|nr:mitochondrial thiamine pyrophosphate transporter [Gaertneriomyces sp. JEL0708]
MSPPKTSKDEKPLHSWQNAVSGATAGIISRFIIAPLDVVKIRFQLQSEPQSILTAPSTARSVASTQYQTIWQSLTKIIRDEGYRGLWKGNLSAGYLYLTYGATQFYAYYEYEKYLTSMCGHRSTAISSFSGALAATSATILTYPFDLLRTRFAIQDHTGPYHSLRSAIVRIYLSEGVLGFYRGLGTAVLQVGPQMGVVFAIWSAGRKHFVKPTDSETAKQSKNFIVGLVAGIVGKTSIMPFDVIRKRLQVQGPTRSSYIITSPEYPKSAMACAKQIVRTEGFLALYKGLVPSLLKSGPSSAVTFLVMSMCERGWRGWNRVREN